MRDREREEGGRDTRDTWREKERGIHMTYREMRRKRRRERDGDRKSDGERERWQFYLDGGLIT